ncbi:MAG TPA: low-specificity L-threonine aldolase [bacterium]
MKKVVDLRSDTVTKPSPAMRQAMLEAEVGDDVFGEDPTVNHLQEMLAELLGKEAALFVPSGTMGNEIAIKCHTRPGDEVICEYGCHVYNYESGAAPFLSGVQFRPIKGQRGVITAAQVEEAIQPLPDHFPRTSLITVENTHNSAGGTIFPLSELERLYALAKQRNLKLHLDGARIWNAAVASGVSVEDYARYCDSIAVCFSKGLGAPVGSAVAGSKKFIVEAHRLRKLLGGGMRQAGILAAAARYALQHNFDRLHEDHLNARFLAEELCTIPGIKLDLEAVQTNIVIFDIEESGTSVQEILQKLKENGVLVVPFGSTRIRAVTHLDVNREEIKRAIRVVRGVLNSN